MHNLFSHCPASALPVQPGMSVACRAEVELQTARETEDFRMDSMLTSQCDADISKTCAGVEEGEEGHGLVLKCLVDNHKDLSASCQTEVREEGGEGWSRKIRSSEY